MPVRSGLFVAYGSIRLFSSVLRSLPYFFLVLSSSFRFAAPERPSMSRVKMRKEEAR